MIGSTSFHAKAYHNPVTGSSFIVELDANQEGTVSYVLINSAGVIVRKGVFSNSVEFINVNGISKGIYLLQFSNGEKIKIDKR